MLFDGVGKPFPVIYCDGETEMNLGFLRVDPTMNIKTLLFFLSEKTKISPHQFSVFLADQNSDRKIPLTAKVNLAAVCCDGAAYYFYVKRFKRSKKSPVKNKNLSERRMLQRRDGAVDGTRLNGVRQQIAAPPPSTDEYAEMERRTLNWRKEREAFLMSMGIKVESFRRETLKFHGGGSGGESVNGGGSGGGNVNDGGSGSGSVNGGRSAGGNVNGGGSVGGNVNGGGGGGRSGGAVCRECLRASLEGTSVDFHLCCYDEVIVGFRTSAGPISRPVRNSGENGH